MTRLPLLALLLTSLTFFAQSPSAEIYRTTDEQGNVIFTDKPPAGASTTERIELPPTNTTPATVVRPRPETESEGAGHRRPGL